MTTGPGRAPEAPCGQLDGRRALITGAGAGIGRATALRFAKEGAAAIAIVDRVPSRLDCLAEKLANLGSRPVIIEADLADLEAARTAATEAVRLLGGVDVVVSNAGASALESFVDTSMDTLKLVFAVNVFAGYLIGQVAARDMIRRGEPGVLLYTASTSDTGGMPEVPAYSASKAAIINLVRSIAPVLARDGIRVNAVSPGFTRTSMGDDLAGPTSALVDIDRIVAPQIPLGRQATPDDIAATFTFLASDQASYITGANILIDGGLSSRSHWVDWMSPLPRADTGTEADKEAS